MKLNSFNERENRSTRYWFLTRKADTVRMVNVNYHCARMRALPNVKCHAVAQTLRSEGEDMDTYSYTTNTTLAL